MNERIRQVNDDFAELLGTFTVACECADGTCIEMIEIPAAAYEQARRSSHTFVVLPGHVDPAVERVVARHPTHVVVEMTGDAARAIIEETAPARSRGLEER